MWMSYTVEDYTDFLVSPSLPPLAPPTSGTSTASRDGPRVYAFNKGIKRDDTAYPTITNDKYHIHFTERFTSVARAQEVANVLKASYMPCDLDELALFTKQKIWLFSILQKCVQTDKGHEIIQEEADKDHPNMQAIWQKLLLHWQHSTENGPNPLIGIL